MLTAEAGISAQMSAISGSASNWLYTKAILAGGIGLLAVIVSVFLLVWFGRKVTGDLTGLYTSVRGMAEERLPRVVERLRRGEDVDVLAESPPPGTSGILEISQIARSFGIVQEAAVAAAVEQARLRKGVNQVFLNISMRNQSLLHRQLGMLDSMERRTSEPGALADLFRLDHLTTRMRRHAEGLIILSGSTPGRGWREPVPVVDVLRAAVAEVEDYVRVDVLSESRDLVAGNAVNDVIHLVAELVENATVFSPPNTRIEVQGGPGGHRPGRGGRGPRPGAEPGGTRRHQPAAGEPARVRPREQRAARPVRRQQAGRQALHQGVAAPVGVRGHDGHPAAALRRDRARGRGGAARRARRTARASPRSRPGACGRGRSRRPEADRLPAWAAAGFGATGRHRLAAAATGRRADTDVTAWGQDDETPRAATAAAAAVGVRAGRAGAAPGGRRRRRPPGSRRGTRSPARPGSIPSAGPRSGESRAGRAVTRLSRRRRHRMVSRRQPSVASPGRHLGMPIRVPQASLAPQLRARADGGQQAAGGRASRRGARRRTSTRGHRRRPATC